VTEKVSATMCLGEELIEEVFGDCVIGKGVMKIFNGHVVRRRGDEGSFHRPYGWGRGEVQWLLIERGGWVDGLEEKR
jgi:hypothetical protein